MNEINIGEKIKLVLESKGLTVTEFARRINKSRENIYSIFTRKTIDTGLLQSISTVLEYDFFQLYLSSTLESQEKIDRLSEENRMLKELNGLLKEKIEKG